MFKHPAMQGAILSLAIALSGLTQTSIAQDVEPGEQNQSGAQSEDCIPASALDTYIQLRWERRVDQWDAIDVPEGAIVFLGSSIIEEGEWAGLFPDVEILNRGIGSDTTEGVLKRLDQIIDSRPSKVFVYIGGNDFSRLGDTPGEAWGRVQEIVQELRASLPDTELYLHTLFPREARHAGNIEAFNDLVRERGKASGALVVDVYPWFLGANGAIDPEYANDGIHLSGEAYQIWADRIRSFVQD